MSSDQYDNHSEPVQSRATGPIVVGVVPGQPPAVIECAAGFAACLGVEIVCLWVDPTSYMEPADGRWDERPAPIDPDGVDSPAADFTSHMETMLAGRLKPFDVSWSYHPRAGEPARELSRMAARARASMIVVGTREPGFGARLEELLTGSVAVHLAHHQTCPVMVVPLHPKPFSEPWR